MCYLSLFSAAELKYWTSRSLQGIMNPILSLHEDLNPDKSQDTVSSSDKYLRQRARMMYLVCISSMYVTGDYERNHLRSPDLQQRLIGLSRELHSLSWSVRGLMAASPGFVTAWPTRCHT